jgi:hypothetical protein
VAKPKVRIVHQGGPAALMRVFVGEEQLLSVSKVELVLDAADHRSVSARLTIHDVDLDVVGDLAEVETRPRRQSILAPKDHCHVFPTAGIGATPQETAVCACGLTWGEYEAARMAAQSAPPRLIGDGGPELFIPSDAPSSYITPSDGT